MTIQRLKEFPTVLEVYDCIDSRQIPQGILMIFVDGPELNDLIQEMLPVGVIAEFHTWSFQPTLAN